MENNVMYVVGIGASAGGLEALQDLFKEMPTDAGAAYVVIQHLSPDYKSIMDEILSKCTQMPVVMVEDGIKVEPNHVYLLPPKKEMTMEGDCLRLEEQGKNSHVNLAIDIFFKSLSEACASRAVGIILSGAGSDGTQGIQYIKENGGMVMVQEPDTAAFDSMPLNAIQTGLVDYVMPPAYMGNAMQNYILHTFNGQMGVGNLEEEETFRKILGDLKDRSGIDFSDYKEQTVRRRMERRANIKQFYSLSDYYHMFQGSEQEKEGLLKEFLIGVTSFFRDKEAFEYLRDHVIPELHPQGEEYRIWSVACSTGEEAYTLAMLMDDYLEREHSNLDFKIFATDIDQNALEIAGLGIYSGNVTSAIPPEYLKRYFTKVEGGYKVTAAIRKRIIFSLHDVLTDPPFSKLDLVVCRNLFIYLKHMVQQNLLGRFHYSLNSDGYLFMGKSESIGEMDNLYQPKSRKYKIYKKKEVAGEILIQGVPMSMAGNYTIQNYRGRDRSENGISAEKIIEKAFAAITPPAVIVNENDNIIYTGVDVNQILQFRPGVFTQNIFANLPHGLSIFVNGVLRRLRSGEKQASAVCATGIPQFPEHNILIEGYQLEVMKSVFYLLTFETVEQSGQNQEMGENAQMISGERIADLEEELRITRENLQSTIEELETSNEELQSTNEELVAANEELQSTNEELQSVNEELYTVNSEYQSKLDEMAYANADMDNLLENVEVGAIYLDNQFYIRKITPMISKITNIMDVDVGRPISHLSLMDNYPNWKEDIELVYNTRQILDREISEPGGKYWLVRIRPYRMESNTVEGIIMTFVEATELRKMRNTTFVNDGKMCWQRQSSNVIRWRYNPVNEMCTIYTTDGSAVEVEKVIPKENFFNMIHEDDRGHVLSALQELVNTDRTRCELTYRIGADGEYYMKPGWVYVQSYKINEEENDGVAVLQGTVTNI